MDATRVLWFCIPPTSSLLIPTRQSSQIVSEYKQKISTEHFAKHMESQINRNSNIKRALYLIKELSILIIELSNSNRELSYSIKELSNTTYPIRELFNWISALSNYTYKESV